MKRWAGQLGRHVRVTDSVVYPTFARPPSARTCSWLTHLRHKSTVTLGMPLLLSRKIAGVRQANSTSKQFLYLVQVCDTQKKDTRKSVNKRHIVI
jgi:hypothetical protein